MDSHDCCLSCTQQTFEKPKKKTMKKVVALVAIVAFMGGLSAPAFANENASVIAIELADKDPKKAEKKDKKSSDCSATEKAAKKSSDCSATEKTAKKSSDCSTPCGAKK